MIGVGWLPRHRPRGLRRPPLAYTRLRRRSRTRSNREAPSTTSVNTEIVLFDRGPCEFPVATVRPRSAHARAIALVGALQAWLVAQWKFLRPRAVPCAVAGAGMLAVLAFSDYLTHYQEVPAQHAQHVQAVHLEVAPR